MYNICSHYQADTSSSLLIVYNHIHSIVCYKMMCYYWTGQVEYLFVMIFILFIVRIGLLRYTFDQSI